MADGGINAQALEAVEIAAQLGVLGFNPLLFLTTRDTYVRNLMQMIGAKMREMRDLEMENQAKLIAKEVGNLFKK